MEGFYPAVLTFGVLLMIRRCMFLMRRANEREGTPLKSNPWKEVKNFDPERYEVYAWREPDKISEWRLNQPQFIPPPPL